MQVVGRVQVYVSPFEHSAQLFIPDPQNIRFVSYLRNSIKYHVFGIFLTMHMLCSGFIRSEVRGYSVAFDLVRAL